MVTGMLRTKMILGRKYDLDIEVADYIDALESSLRLARRSEADRWEEASHLVRICESKRAHPSLQIVSSIMSSLTQAITRDSFNRRFPRTFALSKKAYLRAHRFFK